MACISLNQIKGWLAHWVVRQHPFNSTDGIEAVNARISDLPIWNRDVDDFPHLHVGSWSDLEALIAPAIFGTPEAEAWNTPRSRHDKPLVFSSRYDAPSKDDDFIDIHALVRNVTLSAFREDSEYEDDNERVSPIHPEASPT